MDFECGSFFEFGVVIFEEDSEINKLTQFMSANKVRARFGDCQRLQRKW